MCFFHLQHDLQLTSNRIKKELSRLERNKERRHAREKQKGLMRSSQEVAGDGEGAGTGGTPAESSEKQVGTTRKCANCGQVGHIKTNKKYSACSFC